MTSKAERKRRSRSRNRSITLSGGDAAEPSAGQGARTDLKQPDQSGTVIEARARMLAPLGKAAQALAKTDMAGCAVGRALLMDTSLSPEERADLWDAVKHLRRVSLAYDRALGAPNRHAQSLSILAPSETLTTRADDPPHDDRPEDERYRSAIRAYMTAQVSLGYADTKARRACIAAVVDDNAVSDWQGVKLALACVADGLKGRDVLYRCR